MLVDVALNRRSASRPVISRDPATYMQACPVALPRRRQNVPMTDCGTPPPDDASTQASHVAQASASSGTADHDVRGRFGAAASILDSLDTRPLHMRLRRRPWWKFW